MENFVLANARIPTQEERVSILIEGGRISRIATDEQPMPSDVTVYDVDGRLVSPPFVDAHFHLDSVLTRIPNATGTLREGIDNWGIYKKEHLTAEDVYERADRYCNRALEQGILAIRSHVDVSDPELRGVEGLLRLREAWADRIDIQLVAFPQDGFFGSSETESQLLRALDMGVDVVGGIPHNERTTELGWRSLERIAEIAEKRGLLVDIHCDESDDPLSRHVEVLAEETRRRGLAGRVVASHITSTATMDPYYLHRKLLPLMLGAHLNVVVNPLINVHLGGHFHHPAPRGMAPIKDLMSAGLSVACAQDCNEDPWYPLGNANMIEVAKMGAHLGHMMGTEELKTMFETVTTTAADIMQLDGFSLDEGTSAHCIVLDAPGTLEALRTDARRLAVIRNGETVAGSLEAFRA